MGTDGVSVEDGKLAFKDPNLLKFAELMLSSGTNKTQKAQPFSLPATYGETKVKLVGNVEMTITSKRGADCSRDNG